MLKNELEPTGVMAFCLRAKLDLVDEQDEFTQKREKKETKNEKKERNSKKQHKNSDNNQKIRGLSEKTGENYDRPTGMNWVKAVNKPIERASMTPCSNF